MADKKGLVIYLSGGKNTQAEVMIKNLGFYHIKGSLNHIRTADAVYMTPGWTESTEAKAEWREAVARGKRIFYSMERLEAW